MNCDKEEKEKKKKKKQGLVHFFQYTVIPIYAVVQTTTAPSSVTVNITVQCIVLLYGASLYEQMAIDDGLPGTGLGDNAQQWCKSGDPMLATAGFLKCKVIHVQCSIF